MYKENYNTDLEVADQILTKIRQLTKRQKKEFSYSNSALLVLDMQKFFLVDDSHAFVPAAKAIVPKIKKVIQHFKKQNSPVIFTRHFNDANQNTMMKNWWRELIGKDSVGFEIIDDLSPYVEIIIDKSEYDAFYQTNLNELLISKNIKSLVIIGIMTNLCIDCTARSGFIHNYEIATLIDCVAAYNLELHQSSLISLSHGISFMSKSDDLIFFSSSPSPESGI
jgi:nicotinamidase-related amidase